MVGPTCHYCRRLVLAGGSHLSASGAWVCDRDTCRSMIPAGAAVAPVLEVVDGVPIVQKNRVRATFEVDDMFEDNDGVWRIIRVGPGGIDVRCVTGRRTGSATTWSNSPHGLRRVTEEDVEKRRIDAIVERVVERDETQCPNCWPNAEDKTDLGRDLNCTNHVPPAAAIEDAIAGRRKMPAFIKQRKDGEIVDRKTDDERWKRIKKELKAKGVALPEAGKGFRERLKAVAEANGIDTSAPAAPAAEAEVTQ